MKITKLVVEGYQIVKAVSITPDGNIVTISGDNDMGKSSILDAIWVAFKGRSVAAPVPININAEKCVIRVETEDYVITRTFTPRDGKPYTDTLKVESADGRSRVQRPQETLDELLGAIGIDPFAFTMKKPEDQAETLLEMVPLSIDLDDLARKDFSDIEKRRDANRDAAALKAQIDGLPAVPADTPDKLVDRDAILTKLSSAADTNSAIERERNRRRDLTDVIQRRIELCETNLERAKALRAEADKLCAEVEMMANGTDERQAEFKALPALDEPVDTQALREQLAAAEQTNRHVELVKRRDDLTTRHTALLAESQGFSDLLDARENERREALGKAKMPIEGLAFAINDKGKPVVMYRGVPFSQASTAVKIKASTAIAMAASPELRVLRIKDGSLLDKNSLAIIAEMAEAEDYQIWMETVGSEGTGIIIENGEVRGAPKIEDKPAAGEKPKRPRKSDAPEGSLL